MKTRRKFLKNSVGLITGIGVFPSLALQGCSPTVEKDKINKLPLRVEEKAQYLTFFDPAEGAVPNPGMGISGYVHSDHMTPYYPGTGMEERKKKGPLTLDRKTFDRFIELPYLDNIYVRYEWRDIQKEKGKLTIPDGWKWTLESCEKYGKRWSFRVMNCMKGSVADNGLPEFLQGKLKMIPYWAKDSVAGDKPKFSPEYSKEYLDYWAELNFMLGAEFDKHPLLEYVDVSGYGFWGEGHHFASYALGGPNKNYQPGTPEQVEAINDRLIKDHLSAYPTTPAVLNLHASEYRAGVNAFEQGLCWPRRDSFHFGFSTTEVTIAQGLKPGSAMVWELLRPGFYCPEDKDFQTSPLYAVPQRYFDIQAHYVAVGFNPWEAIWAQENCLLTNQFIEKNIGYRIRPSIVWHRLLNNKDEIVLGLRNDGCSTVPGQLTINALFPDGSTESIVLPAGEPAPGAMKMYPVPLKNKIESYSKDAKVKFSMKIQMRGKSMPVQWAVKNSGKKDNLVIDVPLSQYKFGEMQG